MRNERPFWESATKLVLLGLTFVLIIKLLLANIDSIKLLDLFNNALMMVLAFYFGQKTANEKWGGEIK